MNISTHKKRIIFVVAGFLILTTNLAYSQIADAADKQATSVSIEAAMAVIYLISFSIQQFLEIIDPFVLPWIVSKLQLLGGNDKPEAAIKKSAMLLLSFMLGLLACVFGGINLLKWIPIEPTSLVPNWLGYLFSALVLGSGTESVNIAQKYFAYAKDNKKIQSKAQAE